MNNNSLVLRKGKPNNIRYYDELSKLVGKTCKNDFGTYLIIEVTTTGFVHYGTKIEPFSTFISEFKINI